jgi:DNA processing protein
MSSIDDERRFASAAPPPGSRSGVESDAERIFAACGDCLRRSWLLARLSEHLERVGRRRTELADVLSLTDAELIAALGGERRGMLAREHRRFDPAPQRAAAVAAGLSAVCRHDDRYPAQLRDADDAPAVMHVHGSFARFAALAAAPAVAIVGARLATEYGLEVAGALGRGLAATGVTVVSGLALGVDSAAHAGALAGGGATIAVLAGAAERPYPRSKAHLHRRIADVAAVVSEMPPGFTAQRWCFPARNRVIAGLAQATIVVEATDRSGSLITADFARALGRDVGAVPGEVLSSRATGTNALIFDGALLVRDAGDVLDLLFGAAPRPEPAERTGGPRDLDPDLRRLLDAIERGRTTLARLARTPAEARAAMAGLAELELLGLVRRGPAGSYVRVAP